MRRALATASIAGAVALVPLAATPASADATQLAAGSAVASSETNDDGGNDMGKWGLLGLLGLPGLFGYRKYKEHHARTTAGGTDTSRRV